MKHVIVCAANRHDGIIIAGVRHWDSIMRGLFAGPEIEKNHPMNVAWEQGFLDNKYQFLTRTEAWKVAEAAGQIVRRCGGDEADDGTLYSENLY